MFWLLLDTFFYFRMTILNILKFSHLILSVEVFISNGFLLGWPISENTTVFNSAALFMKRFLGELFVM